MELGKFLLWRKGIIIALSVVLSGCHMLSAHESAEEKFQLSLSGLTSVENLKFTGEAALRRNEQRWYEEQYTYEGQLTNHNILSLQRKKPMEGTGNIVTEDLHVDKLLVRFNPLSQLEGISTLNKQIHEELGASRGTTILRIELEPEDALKWLAHQLSSEMESLKPDTSQKTNDAMNTTADVEAIWKQGSDQLKMMLKEARVRTVYHLTMDSKNKVPLRLTSETTISYLDLEGNRQQEMMVNDVVVQ
ncbi:hypothetical protein [Paenibacillus sp. CMAA1364]